MIRAAFALTLTAVASLALVSAASAAPDTNPTGYVAPTYIGLTPQDVGVMDRSRPEYDPAGIPVGGFLLFPLLDVAGSYDDNVFRVPNGQSDYFLTVSPSFRLQSNWGRHFLEFYGGAENYDYDKFTQNNLTDWKFGADGRFDISRAAVFAANVYYGEFHEQWSSPNNLIGFQNAPNRFYQGHADTSFLYQPNRLGIEFGGSFDRYQFTDTPAIGGGEILNGDRNEDEYQAYAKLSYAFSPGYSVFAKAAYDERDFDDMFDRFGFDEASTGEHYDGGVDLQITHLVTGEAYLGYMRQDYRQDVPLPLENFSGLDFGGSLKWFASPVWTFHLLAGRQLSDVIVVGASASDDKFVNIGADYEFRRNILVQGYFAYTSSHFVGLTRTDNYPSAGISIKYLIDRDFDAHLSYDYGKRTSNAPGANYTDNLVSVGITLHL